MGNMLIVGLVGLVIMIGLILLGMNIGLSMFLVGFLGYCYVVNLDAAMGVLRTYAVTAGLNFTLSVIPLFVLMGQFAYYSGISDDLFRSSRTIAGRAPGGLAYAAIGSCAAFGAICGSLPATTSTMCTVAKPIMREYKYRDDLIGGTLACGGTLGTLIPPSTPFIMYGIAAEMSIGKLFAAGIIPGIIMAICFCGIVFIQTRINPDIAPGSRKYSMKEKLVSLKGFAGMIVLFAIVLGGMFSGVFSITESAAAGAFAAFLIMVIRKRASVKIIIQALKDTVIIVGQGLIIVIGAAVFGTFLTITNLPTLLAGWVDSLTIPGIFIIAVIILIYAALGCIMDTLSIVLLTVPIFLPIVRELGYDPIWFGVVIVMVMNLGAITPPVGLGCYAAAGALKDIPLPTIFKGCVPFLAAFAVSFLIVVLFPSLSLLLPGLIS